MLEVLFLESDNLRKEYIINSLKTCDCNIMLCSLEDEKKTLENILKEKTYHFVFSIDYISSVAVVCDKSGTKYVSWVYDHAALLQDLGNIGVYTNYVFINEYSLYEKFVNDGLKTIYFLPVTLPDDNRMYEQYICFMYTILFKSGELEIFDAIQCLEETRRRNGNRYWVSMMNECFKEYGDIKKSYIDEIYHLLASEKKPFFSLKDQLTFYIDGLLRRKDKDISWEVFTWYKRNFTSELLGIFWEFYCLAIFVNISIEELHRDTKRNQSSLLQYESMNEMCRVFLQTVFYLRRIEYDIVLGEEREIFTYIDEMGLSEIALKHIVDKSQIFDKEKVREKLQKIRRKYRNE